MTPLTEAYFSALEQINRSIHEFQICKITAVLCYILFYLTQGSTNKTFSNTYTQDKGGPKCYVEKRLYYPSIYMILEVCSLLERDCRSKCLPSNSYLPYDVICQVDINCIFIIHCTLRVLLVKE